jgi:HAD superfamily hydrolase (TIGR01509 family)
MVDAPPFFDLLGDEKYQGMIFDCDGTLVDSMSAHYAALHQTLASYGIPFPRERFDQTAGMPTHLIIRWLAEERGKTVDPAALVAARDHLFFQMEKEVQANEPVVALAKHYRGQLPLAVASGSTRRMVTFELEKIGILQHFAALVCAEDVTHPKPHPEPFLRAAQQIGIAPEDCLALEDAAAGIQSALGAGMTVLDVRNRRLLPRTGGA